jgi:hypothetical protein
VEVTHSKRHNSLLQSLTYHGHKKFYRTGPDENSNLNLQYWKNLI